MENYKYAYEMFNDMMNFAIKHGMTSYQSDLMHDAVRLERTEIFGDPEEFIWVVKSNGCGTWLYRAGSDVHDVIINDGGAKAVIKYDGDGWTFNQL